MQKHMHFLKLGMNDVIGVFGKKVHGKKVHGKNVHGWKKGPQK